jgi:hypothetical protein
MLGFDFAAGKVSIGGEGKTPISFTARRDVARFVAHVLTTLPLSDLTGRTFRIEGERTVRLSLLLSPLRHCLITSPHPIQTFSDVIGRYQEKSGKSLDITYQPSAELQQALAANPRDFRAQLLLAWDRGEGVVGKAEEVDNELWPEWRPKDVLQVLLPE